MECSGGEMILFDLLAGAVTIFGVLAGAKLWSQIRLQNKITASYFALKQITQDKHDQLGVRLKRIEQYNKQIAETGKGRFIDLPSDF